MTWTPVRLGDMFGRKRVFLAGMVFFALGSVVSGAAGDQGRWPVGC
jgi:MFS family permease